MLEMSRRGSARHFVRSASIRGFSAPEDQV
jgi:hypothetical protein